MRKAFAFVAGSLLLFLMSVQAQAYTFQMNRHTGQPYRWAAPVRPQFVVNSTNISGLMPTQVYAALTNALQRWKFAGSTNIDFGYTQSTGYSATGDYDGINNVFFQSNTSAPFKMGGGTIGVTSTVYNTVTNRIVEADVWFNDEYFHFTTTPSHSSAWSYPNVFLEGVAVHEFGHAFGLGHSAVLQSSMVYEENRGQAYPSCDDVQGIGALYPAASFATGRGEIRGVVKYGGSVVTGAHVLAISKTRGTVIAGAISAMGTGAFSLPNLEPGDYYLFVEPFQTADALDALCGSNAGCHWSALNATSVCAGGAPFKRMFVESVAGFPSAHLVTAGGSLNVGDITVGCAAMANVHAGTSARNTAPTVLANVANAETSSAVRAVAGGSGSTQYFLLSQIQGTLSVKVLSFSLYSNFDPSVTLVDAAGNAVAGATAVNNVFTSRSSFVNYDSQVTIANNGPAADYYVKVTNNQVASSGNASYPGGSGSQIDPVSYYLVVATVNDSTSFVPSALSPTLATNARCEPAADAFAPYPGTPIDVTGGGRAISSSSGSGAAGAGAAGAGKACGSIVNVGDRKGPPGPGDALFSIWGVAFMLGVCRLLQQLARRHHAR